MRKGPEHSKHGANDLVDSTTNLFSNAWALFAATAALVAPFAVLGLAVYGALNLLTLSTVLTVAAVFVFAAYILYGNNEPKVDPKSFCTASW